MVTARRSFLLVAAAGALPGQTDRTSLGLKEALTVGLNNAVNLTGRLDGYFKNEAIKILMPEKLQPLAKGLMLIGMRPKIDEFVLAMNRAAEAAAPLAKPIFADAIKTFSFGDAKALLSGSETAITDFFERKTKEPLTVAFRPPVVDAMAKAGATRQYQELVGRFQKIPFAARLEQFNLEDYVVGKALSGLFYMVAQEEKQIRRNPAARVSSVLRDVFGKR